MASLTLRRPDWCLQISRSSKAFTVSFTTYTRPHGADTRRVAADASRRSRSNYKDATHPSLRSMFTSTRPSRAQQVASNASSQKPNYPSNTTTKPNGAPSTPPPVGTASQPPDVQDLSDGLADQPFILDEGNRQVDWANSFHGLSSQPFPKEVADILLQSVAPDDIEVKPDGIIYLPEIKYRRILNSAFGPGGWGLAPRGETIVTAKAVTREYALVAHGRLISVARGEQDYFSPEGIPTATEGCKSNAMMRCCKDLGVASELWDPRFIRRFMGKHAKEIFVEHAVTKKRKKIWLRKDDDVRYPFKETKGFGS
ncbi:MAG: hypothetical protein M1827_005850 [Pycnora praestabilis]|nr:MAG: hypothetical protein M1827_005850 [Pycnora praestabilis]